MKWIKLISLSLILSQTHLCLFNFHRNVGESYRFFFAAKLTSWRAFWIVLKVVVRIVRWVLWFNLGMAFVDNWVVGKEKVCYWLSNDIVGLVGNLAV